MNPIMTTERENLSLDTPLAVIHAVNFARWGHALRMGLETMNRNQVTFQVLLQLAHLGIEPAIGNLTYFTTNNGNHQILSLKALL